jgi:hypothetical protein
MTLKELREKYPSANFGEVNVSRQYEAALGQNRLDFGTIVNDLGIWRIYLQHSCDEWVIGTPEEARKMADDLQEAANYCEARP